MEKEADKLPDKILFDIVKGSYDKQFQASESLDIKVSNVFIVAIMVATLTITIGGFGFLTIKNSIILEFALIPFTIGIILCNLTMIFALQAWGIGEFYVINPKKAVEMYLDETEEYVRLRFIAEIGEEFRLNMIRRKKITYKLRWAFRFMTFAVVAILIYSIMLIICVIMYRGTL